MPHEKDLKTSWTANPQQRIKGLCWDGEGRQRPSLTITGQLTVRRDLTNTEPLPRSIIRFLQVMCPPAALLIAKYKISQCTPLQIQVIPYIQHSTEGHPGTLFIHFQVLDNIFWLPSPLQSYITYKDYSWSQKPLFSKAWPNYLHRCSKNLNCTDLLEFILQSRAMEYMTAAKAQN